MPKSIIMKSFIKINLFLLFIFLLPSYFSFAQQPDFRWAFNANPNTGSAYISVDQWDNAYLIFRSYNNNYTTTIGDSSYSFNVTPGDEALFFYKVDPLGNLL